jgi:methionine aminotransferase
MHPPIDSKLPRVGTTIFTVMSRLAAEHSAINLSQGFPDFAPPDRLLDLANHHMRQGGAGNQYAPMAGLASLRQAIAEKVAGYYDRTVDPDREITVTSGGTEALFCAIQAIVRAGDEVILLDPAYDSYEPAVDLAGGRAVHVPMRRPGFGVDWQRLCDAITPRTRLVILNFPHNPSGATLDDADLARLAELLRGTGAFVLSDEVYEHMLFDGRKHHSLLTHAELAARSFVVSSFGKTYHATGWKVGYCIAPPRLMQEFQKVHQFVQFVVATPLQAAIADFMRECPQHTRELPAFYQGKRDYFAGLLARTRFKFEPARSTYFQLVDYSELSDLPDTEFARLLTTQHGVAAIPISVFSEDDAAKNERIVRFCFAKHEATLDAAAAKLRLL